ncbi:MAG: MGMT family protein [Alphaproteobacteria bacterium]|nr:MGMT family protein [Alphaproteobacteria bacterium]
MKSTFRPRVYALVRRIPSGMVLGYGDVASAVGNPGAARQVGYALAALSQGGLAPDGALVPWQRVIRSDGSIAMKGDLIRGDLQRRLLEDEGVGFREDRVDMRAHRWQPEVEDLMGLHVPGRDEGA